MEQSNPLLIWGAGGHGKVVVEVAQAAGYKSIVFFDDHAHPGSQLLGFDIVGPGRIADLKPGTRLVIAAGSNPARARCFEMAHERGWRPATVLHPSAIISPSASIGTGTVVMPRVVVNASAHIGDDCILNTGAVVEHDCVLGNHVHVAPMATLAGNVNVGSFAQISMGAAVLPGVLIGQSAAVGAGCVVTKQVSDACTVVGVPARALQAKNLVGR